MDDRLRALCRELGSLTSADAADRLITRSSTSASDEGDAFRLIRHRSWKRSEQVRLAEHFLKKLPFASAAAYEILASIMSFRLFVGMLRDALPTDSGDLELLRYHLLPVLGNIGENGVGSFAPAIVCFIPEQQINLTFPHASESGMRTTDMTDTESLRRRYVALNGARPTSASALANMEALTGLRLPRDFRDIAAFFRWRWHLRHADVLLQ